MAGRVIVRFGGPSDLEWCVVEDTLITERVMRQKITNNEIIVAELDGELGGYLRLEYLWSTIPYIAMVFVIEAYRKEGIGKRILEFTEDFLREHGHEIFLSSSQVNEPEPQAWHRSMGFEECGVLNGINEGGIGEVFFRKKLK